MDYFNNIFKYENGLSVSGLTSELNAFYILGLFEKLDKNLIVVTNSLYETNILYNTLQNYTDKILLFPMDDFLTSVIVAESPELKFTRLETLRNLKKGKHIIITNLMGYLKYLPSKNDLNDIVISINKDFNRDKLVSKLQKYGYHKESLVTSTGEYAVRGFIVDVFLANENHPVRFEFLDNVIDSIRYFDEITQLSIKKVDEITISPIEEIINEEKCSLMDYIDGKSVIFVDLKQIKVSYEKLVNDIFEYKTQKQITTNVMFNFDDIKYNYVTYLNKFESVIGENSINYSSKEIENYNMNFDKLKADVYRWKLQNKKIIICYNNENQKKILNEIDLQVNIKKIAINHGFIFDDLVVIGANDLEVTNHQIDKYKSNYKFGKRIKSYNQLEIGDYVVHITHGIGIYNGLVKLTKNGVAKDYLQILYAGNDKIYVPVEKITNIYKYGEKEGAIPKINKLNSTTWAKTKSYITSKIKDISKELILLYKKRLEIHNTPYNKYPEQDLFNNSFTYTLTYDQSKSVDDIFRDLESNHPMDRLLCGDVGFGKTEVALRAIFATVLNNQQVMYLCPTTILSKQQYNVCINRMKDWPINIAVLNRFVSASDVKKILNDLENGKIDIIFGTHRLLSEDVKFKNLGLLVVDEEQRFGVSHKEKIKKYKNDINVLTLSATPIPRTLKMALSGIRDLSIIDTPPVNRYPVQTYVITENDLLIKDAIYKELSRNGQIFILYNKVDSIEAQVRKISLLIPEARIRYAHGQMKKEELEDRMADFVSQKYDILVCTTIIENGIDIPNVNTLIVYDADRFGLSQLYQIRGRVGRSNKIAYCYLLYQPNKILNEIAVKRLNAIKEFTELGSGYKIAMRDLSIRGAGDIFGASQAGFVDSVGISLYLKMINDEIKRQQGIPVEDLEESSDQSLLNIETHISDSYVSDEDIKIEIHQKINEINGIEKFKEVKAELEDRFGKIGSELETYMYEEWFSSLAKKYNITKVVQNNRFVEIELPVSLSEKIQGDKLLMSAFQISHDFNLKYERNRIFITLYLANLQDHFVIYLIKLLEKLEFK